MRVLNDEENPVSDNLKTSLTMLASGGTTEQWVLSCIIYERKFSRQIQHKQDIKDFIYWGDTYCALQNKPRRECGHCWESFKQSTEE